MSAARIERWKDMPGQQASEAAIERIFFAASATQTFANDEIRAAFRARWLGRYLTNDPGLVFVALDDCGAVMGYVIGSFDDPARTSRFADIAFFKTFAPLTVHYPAHLHVNLDERARGHGTGSQLVEVFCDHARAAGLPGVHVVTSRAARNVVFYERLGFFERGVATSNGHEVVLLGRDLT